MKRLLFPIGMFLIVAAINASKTSSRHRAINPNAPIHKPYTFVGYCYCPYNLDQTGNLCGNRSAYIKTGGADPMCYVRDLR
jgi:hypothetical protein